MNDSYRLVHLTNVIKTVIESLNHQAMDDPGCTAYVGCQGVGGGERRRLELDPKLNMGLMFNAKLGFE
jgi:hypothetical protein